LFSTNTLYKIRCRLLSNLDVYAGGDEFKYYLDTNYPASSFSQFFQPSRKLIRYRPFHKFCLSMVREYSANLKHSYLIVSDARINPQHR